MNKILKQFLKQVALVLILIATVAVLNTVFVKSSIKGDYETVTVGITKGTNGRELQKYLKDSFKTELNHNKKIEVDSVGLFGTEFRIKSDKIVEEEKDFIETKIKDRYGDTSISAVTTNPEANYQISIMMYIIYFVIIVALAYVIIYMLYMIPVDEELSIDNIKKNREQIIEEENKRLKKEKKLQEKEEKKALKDKKKAEKNKDKNKKNKKDKVKKDKNKKIK